MTVVDQLSFSKNALNQYVKKIEKLIESEVANEESFYADFRDLLKKFFKTDEFEIIIVPKSEETADKPDFIVYMDNIPIIHIEGKNPYDPVDKWLLFDTTNRLFDQVYRFRGREDNNIPVIVTDFINIWVIDKDTPNSKDCDHQIKLKLKIIDDSGSSWKTYSGIKPKLESALNYVCKDIVLSISKVSSMIPHLVKYAKMLRDEIISVFKENSNPMKLYLESIRNDFLDSIFSSDKERKSQDFADLIAQTLVYGGFVAWMRFCKDGNNSKDFSFNKASKYLPYGTFTFNLFVDISTKSTPEIQDKVISKVERVFQSTQFEKVIENTETLMITFYSNFLWQYDPEIAKDRGIVYTPHPIINFIVRGIDYFSKKYFNISDGIASTNINFLDPAAGTMGFPCEIIRLSKEYFSDKYKIQPGRLLNEFSKWAKNSFLKNTFAFEILMAPYVLGHLRTNMLLDELGVKINPSTERIKLFLFNTLMELQTTLADFRNPAIGQEIVEALNIRNNKKILVVLSNPPYNVSSQNKFEWIERKINYEDNSFQNKSEEEILEIKKKKNDYYWDLQREGTKKITGVKALQDDYVKFIRFAQWKVKQNKYGIVGYITNNYYIDGLVFRGMRSSLYRDFDYIYILNLKGDARKSIPRKIRDQGITNDENVFDIKTGVAIVFLIRTGNHSNDECEIKYDEKWGTKLEKFEYLTHEIKDLTFENIPKRLDHEFCPDEFDLREKYMAFSYILDIFKKHVQGIVTAHDSFISDIDKENLIKKLEAFFNNEDLSKYGTSAPRNRDWDPDEARTRTDLEAAINKIVTWNYRNLDRRFLCYDIPLINGGTNRFQIMQFLISPNTNNYTLIINRQNRSDLASSFLISDTIFEHKCCEGASGLDSYAFPLMVNDSTEPDDYENPKIAKDSNIREEFKSMLSYSEDITDDNIFFYVYSILYSPTYRKRYSIGLMEDFPRIPFPNDKDVFLELARLGKKLANFHLIKDGVVCSTEFTMSSSEDYHIYDIRKNDKDSDRNQIPDTYDPKTQRIYLKKRTKAQIQAEKEGDNLDGITWIEGISQEMWDFEIGGRQQLKDWLYFRRYSPQIKKYTIQRPLNSDELEYFLMMCDAIKKTIELLPELDEVYKRIDP